MLCHRSLPVALGKLGPTKAQTKARLRLCNKLVEFTAHELILRGQSQAVHLATLAHDSLDHVKLGARKGRGYISKLKTESHVRLVGPESLHCFVVSQSLKWLLYRNAQSVTIDTSEQTLDYRHNLLGCGTGHFHVDLGKFGLPVGSQILVAETLGDLVVTVESGDHQNLLEQLWRLGKRVKTTGIYSAGNEIIACPLGCRPP